MNVTEIRKLVRQSESKSWYTTVTIKIRYWHSEFEIDLKGLDIIYQFFKKQLEFYSKLESLPAILTPSKNHFESSVIMIESFVQNTLKPDSPNKENDWRRVSSHLSLVGSRADRFFNKESATTDFLLKLDSEYLGASNGAYDFFTNQNFKYNIVDKNYFIGWNRAYEFFTQDMDLVKRRNNERHTLSKIRSEYLKKLEITDSKVSEHIAEKEKKYLYKEKTISRLIKRKNKQYEDWKISSQSDFSKFLTDSDSSFKELEELYQEN